ncbi:MAG: hypothetical protein GY841_18600, partial [FCB group bacterium]|nr:hypothetical protein [FCB group bacterium]
MSKYILPGHYININGKDILVASRRGGRFTMPDKIDEKEFSIKLFEKIGDEDCCQRT